MAVPVTVSNPISDTSISCPATPLATVSPTPPPPASIAVPVAMPFNLGAVLAAPATDFVAFAAIPAVIPSITPIAIPLPAARLRILPSFSGSDITSLTFSNVNSFPSNSSIRNSLNDMAVSKDPLAPITKPLSAPPIAPGPPATPAPIAAPAPAPAAPYAKASASNMPLTEEVNN